MSLIRRVLVAALLAAPAAAPGQQVEQDGFRVHYAALSTRAIPVEAARKLGITVRRDRALLLLNVQRSTAPPGTPLPATASGVARSLNGPVHPLAFRKTADGDLVAEFQVLNQEWITFDLAVTPAGAGRPVPVRFQQQFWYE